MEIKKKKRIKLDTRQESMFLYKNKNYKAR